MLHPILRLTLAMAVLGPAAHASTADPALEPARVLHHVTGTPLPVERNFQGIPGLAISPGGRLFATWYGGGTDESGVNYCMLSSSDDGGATWSDIQLVVDHPHPAVRTFDPVLWTDPNGKLWLFYAQSHTWWDGRAGVWAITCENPDAAAPAWSAPRRLADGIMMNKPTVLRDGRWLFPIALWGHAPKSDPADTRRYVPPEYVRWDESAAGTQVYSSADGGQTLELLATVQVPNVMFDEHMFVELRDGSLWMLVRTRAGMAESFSADGGRTWSEAVPARIPHINARFFIRRLLSGRLLLVKHNPSLDVLWLNNPPSSRGRPWQQRSHLTAYLSDDDGATWYGGLLLDERLSVSYPDGDQTADGRIFIIYDRDRKEAGDVLLAVFTEEDVAAGRLQDPRSALRLQVDRMATND